LKNGNPVIDHYVPHYDQDAGSKTVFQYLKLFVSLGFNVKFIGDNFCRQEPYTNTLQQMGIEVLYGPWYADNWKKWVAGNGDKLDWVLLSRPHITIKYIDFIRKNTKAKILYYGHDLHFVRELKQYEIEKDPALLESSKKWKETEISIYLKSDIILTPSDNERKIIQELIPGSNEPITNFSERKHILFVGGFTHKPNVDAVLWFVKQVWPVVIKQHSGLQFIIAGSNPPDVIRKLADNNIIVKGYISDRELGHLYNSVKLVVVPLRYGAGVKGKTVEAMRYGLPVVTTDIGVEGLPGDYSFLKPANEPAAFAEQIIALYNDEKEMIMMSRKGTQYINENFTKAIATEIISRILTTV
jgi:O-antigen biosynthesis protein